MSLFQLPIEIINMIYNNLKFKNKTKFKIVCKYYHYHLDNPFLLLYNNSFFYYNNILFYCSEHFQNYKYDICEEKICLCTTNNTSHVVYYHTTINSPIYKEETLNYSGNVNKKKYHNIILNVNELYSKESLICFNIIDYDHIILNYYTYIGVFIDNNKFYEYNYLKEIQPKYINDPKLQLYLEKLQKGKMFIINRDKDYSFNYEIKYYGYYLENNNDIFSVTESPKVKDTTPGKKGIIPDGGNSLSAFGGEAITYFRLELFKNSCMFKKDWHYTTFSLYIYTNFYLFDTKKEISKLFS